MKGAVEYFVGTIILIVAIYLMASYIAASIDTANARDFHAAVVAEIEAGNFSQKIIEKCKGTAEENGYVLSVEAPIELQNHEKMAEVVLTYQYSIALLDIKEDVHEIRGVAR